MPIKFEVLNRWTGDVQFVAEIDCDESAVHSVKMGLAVKWGIKARANLAGADLADAYLAGADLAGANLARANLAGANLARAYLARAYLAGADLADANLAGANLAGADLAGAYLARAYLARAYLAGANLAGANLVHANLTGANLAGADLADANLAGADLAGANLARANLARANLAGANLAGAYLAGAYLAGANLADAVGLTDAQLRSVIADYWMILTRARPEVPALIAAIRDGRVDGSTYSGECACLVGTLENSGATGLPHEASSPAERWFATIRKGDKPGDETAGGFAASKALQWALEYCAFAGIDVEAV